jgi:hypothetical protein
MIRDLLSLVMMALIGVSLGVHACRTNPVYRQEQIRLNCLGQPTKSGTSCEIRPAMDRYYCTGGTEPILDYRYYTIGCQRRSGAP